MPACAPTTKHCTWGFLCSCLMVQIVMHEATRTIRQEHAQHHTQVSWHNLSHWSAPTWSSHKRT